MLSRDFAFGSFHQLISQCKCNGGSVQSHSNFCLFFTTTSCLLKIKSNACRVKTYNQSSRRAWGFVFMLFMNMCSQAKSPNTPLTSLSLEGCLKMGLQCFNKFRWLGSAERSLFYSKSTEVCFNCGRRPKPIWNFSSLWLIPLQ